MAAIRRRRCDTWHSHVYSYIEFGRQVQRTKSFVTDKNKQCENIRTTWFTVCTPFHHILHRMIGKNTFIHVVGSNVAWKLLHLTSSISVDHIFIAASSSPSIFLLVSLFWPSPSLCVCVCVYCLALYYKCVCMPNSQHFISIQFANSYSLFVRFFHTIIRSFVSDVSFSAIMHWQFCEFHIFTSSHSLVSLPYSAACHPHPFNLVPFNLHNAFQIGIVRSNHRLYIIPSFRLFRLFTFAFSISPTVVNC